MPIGVPFQHGMADFSFMFLITSFIYSVELINDDTFSLVYIVRLAFD